MDDRWFRLGDHGRYPDGVNIMAMIMCPYCGVYPYVGCSSQFLRNWYELHHPALPVGTPVAHPCEDCTAEYAIGDHVSIRGLARIEYTVRGVIKTGEAPPIIVASTTGGSLHYFPKSQIRPVAATPIESAGLAGPLELIDCVCWDFAAFLKGPLQRRGAPVELFRPPIIETFGGIPDKGMLISAYKSDESCRNLATNLNEWFDRQDVTRFIAKRLLGGAISHAFGIEELLATGCFE